jgi:exonuclease SbcD
MRIFHTADIHASEANIQEVKKCCDFTLQKAITEKPDLVIIAGDVFDSRDIKLDTQACKYIFQFVNKLSEVAPVCVVTGTPKHEGFATENLIFASSFEHNIIVSTGPEQLFLWDGQLYHNPTDCLEGLSFKFDAVISMLPTPTKQFMQGTDDQISQALTPIFAGFGATASEYNCPHIGVYHGTIRGATACNGQSMIGRDIEISREQIALANFDILCCGHIHLHQEIDYYIFFSGSLFGTNYGETDTKGFYIHEISKGEPFGSAKTIRLKHTFIETPSRKIVNLKHDFTDDFSDLDALPVPSELDDLRGADIKVSLKVWQDEATAISKEEIEKFYKNAGASEVKVDIKYIPREVVRSERMSQLETLADKFAEQAKLKSEILPEGITEIAADLETLSEDQIYEKVTIGYTYGADPEVSAA